MQNFFYEIFNSSFICMALLDADTGAFVEVNEALTKLTGTSKEQYLKMKIQDLKSLSVHLEVWQYLVAVKNHLQTQDVFTLCGRRITENGKIITVEVMLTAHVVQEKKYVLARIQDITEKLITKQHIEKLSFIVEKSPVIVLITNTEGVIEYVNEAFEMVTGYTYEEAIGQNARILNSGKQEKSFYEGLWQTIKLGKVWTGVFQNRKKNGENFWVSASISAILDEKGRILNFVGMQIDITEDIYAKEREIIHTEKILASSKLATLGTLVAGVGHEINNPNNFIMMNIGILKKMWKQLDPLLQMPELQEQFCKNVKNFNIVTSKFSLLLEDVHQGSLRIEKIVKNLRDFSRSEQEDLREELDMNQVISSAIRLLNNLIMKNTKAHILQLDDTLPKVQGSFQKLEQVIIILIKNACEAMHEKPGVLTIATKFLKETNQMEVLVTDQGEGISKEDLAKIRDPFFTTKMDRGGTGLGVSVAANIVEKHQGFLEYGTVVGKGTTARLLLPILPKAMNL